MKKEHLSKFLISCRLFLKSQDDRAHISFSNIKKKKNQNKPNDINELNVMIKQLDQEKFHPRKVKKEIIKRSNPQID